TNVAFFGNGSPFQFLTTFPSSRLAATMACELFLLSSIWFLFVIFWMETISVWLFLCNFYQDRAFYHWGERIFVNDPGHMLYVFV
ncbi:hypothetical protein NDU88_005569, partial [Pleurodeles waltl]